MEYRISQLRKEFKNQIFALSKDEAHGKTSTSILTEEELIELQNAWIQLTIWKQGQAYAQR